MNDVILYIMVVFAVLGAVDRVFGNKFGLGEKFEEGILSMGALALSMVGILALTPVIADVLRPVIIPAFQLIGADPSMFAGVFLGSDMGGAPLAYQLAETKQAGQFSGLILACMLGSTVVFTIPIALGIIKKEDRPYLAKGVLCGIITIPAGAFVGGLVAGFAPSMMLINLLPVFIVSLLIALGLWKQEAMAIKGFVFFGKLIIIVITLGLIAGIVEKQTGIILIPDMAPIDEGFQIVADICIILAGTFPMVTVLSKILRKPLLKLGALLSINEVSASGFLISLANNIPMFTVMKEMDNRGKIINTAFCVSAAFTFGDHLGFAAGFDSIMVVPMIVGKLVGGITAVALSLLICRQI